LSRSSADPGQPRQLGDEVLDRGRKHLSILPTPVGLTVSRSVLLRGFETCERPDVKYERANSTSSL
jgi:hypothetical protein